jgi:phosphoribulokinase
VVHGDIDIAKHPDLLIGVVPVINLEWIQKLWRDKSKRGYSTEAVTDTILRRMPDYVNYICPQFARTHVNFQRVPCVDTSNPFIARDIPAPDESFVVIRFANPKGIDFQYLLNMVKRLLHVARQHHRGAGRKDGTGDAADLHALHLAHDGAQEARLNQL